MSDREAAPAVEPDAGQILWGEAGLVPAIVQDRFTGQVLMLAYVNDEALRRTLETGEAWFWSRSREALWRKGATSGNTQRVREVRLDCDGDAILFLVEPAGPACHTGQQTCFHRYLAGQVDVALPPGGVLSRLEAVIRDRQAHPRPGSYTSQLLEAGLPRILKKVGEEAVESIVAGQSEDDGRLASELADLAYHVLVLLAARGLSWADVEAELARRASPSEKAPR